MYNFNENQWIDIFKNIRKSAMLNTHVSTLARYIKTVREYTKENGYGIVTVSPFPLYNGEEKYNIDVYYFEERTFSTSDNLRIVFADYNFVNNINIYESSTTKDENIHSINFGFIASEVGYNRLVTKNINSNQTITLKACDYNFINVNSNFIIALSNQGDRVPEYKIELKLENGNKRIFFPADLKIKTDNITLTDIVSDNSVTFTNNHTYLVEICNDLMRIYCF